ncbi:MAG: leucine-rich repeat domain-containing protein [Clostridia bacterium]
MVKTKIVTTLISMCLALAVMGFAVWAASTQTLPVVNTVDFTSIHVLSTVTGTVTGAKADTFTNYGPVSTLAGDPEGKLGTWAIGSAMEFNNETELIIITLTIVNDSDERSLSFELSGESYGAFNGTNLGDTNIDRTCKYSINNVTPIVDATYTSGAINVEPLKTATIVFTLDISDNGKSVNAFNNAFSTTLRNVAGGTENFSFNPLSGVLTLNTEEPLTEENLPEMIVEGQPAFYGLYSDQEYTQEIQFPYSGSTTVYAKFAEAPATLIFTLINNDTEYSVATDINNMSTGALEIPSKYNWKDVTMLGANAFKNCTELSSVIVPNTVTMLGLFSFYGCTDLSSFVMPDSVTTVGNGIFFLDTNLTSVTLSNNLTTLGSSMFYGCSKLPNVTIPNSVTTIGFSTFINCTKLSTIVIPNSVTSMKDTNFRNCTNLSSVTLSNNITLIDYSNFYGCTNLPSIKIPSGITNIGTTAFQECGNLKTVIVDSASIANNLSSTTACGVLLGYLKTGNSLYILDSINSINSYITNGSAYTYSEVVQIGGLSYKKYVKI